MLKGMNKAVIRERAVARIAAITLVFGLTYWKWDSGLLYPLRVLMTLIHEFSHAIAAVLTGGHILSMWVNPCLNGMCWVEGGWRWVVLPAGYLGSMAFGCGIIWIACRTSIKKFVSLTLGLLIAGATAMWVHSGFGLVYGVGVGLALASSGWWLSEDFNDLVLCVLGAMNCLASLFGLKYLTNYNGYSDAWLFSKELIPLPPAVWAISWAALSVVCLVLTLRAALRSPESA